MDFPESSIALKDTETLTLSEETLEIVNTGGQQQSSLYKLVPITEYSNNTLEVDEELKLLLKSWGCLNMYDYLLGKMIIS